MTTRRVAEVFGRWEGIRSPFIARQPYDFQHYNHRVKEAQRALPGNTQARAQHELFEADQEEHVVKPDERVARH